MLISSPAEPVRLIGPMLERFIATDRALRRRSAGSKAGRLIST
ncbi:MULTISPECIES: DUF2274 domain-containing protein [unclassified Afipia]|nr:MULTISPECIES: DUF2274 domain-containing protein [unclassified Afipia]MBQ8104023.1 DUF2274 domain-containing protein [Afipia sp.]WIG53919.1 MAG: uncharacterized protein OJF48_004840 [Afipia sp.]